MVQGFLILSMTPLDTFINLRYHWQSQITINMIICRGEEKNNMERIKLVEVRIPQKLYNEISCNCNDPSCFCVDAVKRFIEHFPVD